MSKLLENKQIIHIAAEIVVLVGITFYFSSKNKKLSDHIEDLSQRLEEQEDLIQKHEQIIRQLVQAMNSQTGSAQNKKQVVKPVTKNVSNTKKKLKSRQQQSPLLQPTVSFNDNEEINEIESHNSQEDYSSEDDSVLDAEIADELQELQQQDGLKKRS
jgi:phosphopantetheine adenylyltransferase